VSATPDEKVYIHEFIDIIGPNRANYMHHMTANYSPIAQEERGQLCFGVWGVVGSTARWPQVVNIWQENGFDGLAASFAHEFGHATLQDPKLAKWWAQAAGFRSGGHDRILLPAPWMPTIEQLTAHGAVGTLHAHVRVQLAPGEAQRYLDELHDAAPRVSERFGWQLTGAWRTAMVGDGECILLWTIPSFAAWAEYEQAVAWDAAVERTGSVPVLELHRFLLVDAPLSPFRTGRQPARSDRVDDYLEV
jgi:hypothetical protein